LVLVVVYLTLFTQDLRLGGIPVKVPLVILAVVVWWLERGRQVSLMEFRCARAVLVLGIGVPVFWSLVAVLTRIIGSDIAIIAYGDVVAEASRFGYVLLYFPLADLLGHPDNPRHRGWLWPVLSLAVITWLLWAGIALADGGYSGRSTVLAFSGVFGEQGGAFRVFIANQILFAPAVALLLTRALRVRWSWPTVGCLLLVLSATYHAHTRGLWVALLAVGSLVLLLQWGRLVRAISNRGVAWIVPGSAIVAVGGASALLLTGAVDLPGFLEDQSAGSRVSQTTVLFDGWSNQPVLGSGLGAAIRGGYVRSVSEPWSFELTYLQVLFQMGVIGLLLLLWAPSRLFVEFIRTLKHRPDELARRDLSVAGFATLAGLFLASATNPYLLSAFGMFSVGLGLALADLGLRAPVAPIGARPAGRAPGLPVVAGTMLLIVALAGLEFAGERV